MIHSLALVEESLGTIYSIGNDFILIVYSYYTKTLSYDGIKI